MPPQKSWSPHKIRIYPQDYLFCHWQPALEVSWDRWLNSSQKRDFGNMMLALFWALWTLWFWQGKSGVALPALAELEPHTGVPRCRWMGWELAEHVGLAGLPLPVVSGSASPHGSTTGTETTATRRHGQRLTRLPFTSTEPHVEMSPGPPRTVRNGASYLTFLHLWP